jgi:hypothetical protein
VAGLGDAGERGGGFREHAVACPSPTVRSGGVFGLWDLWVT